MCLSNLDLDFGFFFRHFISYLVTVLCDCQWISKMHSSVLPVQSWACSSHWGENGWHVSGPGSIPHWLSYTLRLRSQERSPQWAPSRHSKRSFRLGQGWRGPPDNHTAVPVVAARAPASSAPVPWSWVLAGNSGLPRKAGKSPGMWS